jgi:hypothetical protein
MARKSSTPSSETTISRAAIDRPEHEPAMPAVSFSPEALSKLLNELTAQRQELAALKAEMVESNKAKIGPVTMPVAAKPDKAAANNALCIKLFKKAGFQNVVPHQNVKTFNLWMAENRRPIEGSKSIKVNNLRLFHVTSTRELTAAEIKAAKDQVKASDTRKGNGKTKGGTVTQLHTPQ